MKYDLYIKMGGQWRYFTYIKGRYFKENDTISVSYDGAIKEYSILHVIEFFNKEEPILLVQENKDMMPLLQEEDSMIDYSLIKKLLRK